MSDERDEEVRRVLEAIEALADAGDIGDRARWYTQLLRDWPTMHARLRVLRQQAVQEMLDTGMSQRAVARHIDVSPGRIKQILDGSTGPVAPRDRNKQPPAPAE